MDKKVGDTERVSVVNNAGDVGAENDISGQVGDHSSVGNTSDIHSFVNTATGNIGSKNEIQGNMGANASVGNTGTVDVGVNSGSIGAKNKINIS
eukprot:superscaffoldBa00004425_g18862